MRTAAKRDTNEAEIVSALRGAGFTVFQISDEGIPDLLVCRQPPSDRAHSYWLLLEVKTGPTKPLTAAQERFFAKTEGLPRFVVTNAEDALAAARYWLGGSLDA